MSKFASVPALIEAALADRGHNHHFAEFGHIPSVVADRIAQAFGLKVSGFVCSIDEAAVRHILKEHGRDETEKLRGQVAVTSQDIADLDKVLMEPDSVEFSGLLPDGTPTLTFKKRLDQRFVCVQEVRVGRKKLSTKTLWKVRLMPPAAVQNTGLVPTSETSQAQPATTP